MIAKAAQIICYDRYLDTMSLHIALSGMTSSQRMFKEGRVQGPNSYLTS
jgi:hypothetical protein